MTRRDFLHSAAATVAAAGITTANDTTNMPIIDTHQHLWDLTRFTLPWVKPGEPLARNYLPADYAKAAEGLNIVKAIYMEVDVDPSQQVAEAEYIIELIKSKLSPTVAAVVSGRPESEGFKDYAMRYKGSPYVKGIRRVLHGAGTPTGHCLQPQFIKSIRLLGELGLSFDLCIRPAELPDMARLIDACPDTRFILDHCGNPSLQMKDLSPWKRDLTAIAKRKHLVCKVSGFIATAKPGQWKPGDIAPIVNHTLDTFGPDRVMFGGDWPVCTSGATLKEWVEGLKAVVSNRPMEQQRKLFAENAVRVYGIG
jgi:predicted TIM-barrel fold metal-dependent hydrolase